MTMDKEIVAQREHSLVKTPTWVPVLELCRKTPILHQGFGTRWTFCRPCEFEDIMNIWIPFS